MRKRNWTLLSGAMASVLSIASVAVQSGAPSLSSSAAEVVSYYGSHKSQEAISAILIGVSAVLFAYFGALLRERLREPFPDHSASPLPLLVFGGSLATAAGFGVGGATQYTLAEAARHLPSSSLPALNALTSGSPYYFSIGLALLIGAMSTLAITRRILPVWLGWVGMIVGAGQLAPGGSIAIPAAACWLIIASCVLYICSSAKPDLVPPLDQSAVRA